MKASSRLAFACALAAILAVWACDAAAAAMLPPGSLQGLWWVPGGAETGWGVNLAHQGDSVFATWYTYDSAGKAWWLSMLASRVSPSSNAYTGTIYVDTGPPFYKFAGAGAPVAAGTGTLTFSDTDNGTFDYSVNLGAGTVTQSKSLARFVLDATSPQPSCAYGAAPDLPAAANYQDLWWSAGGTEPGWGINFAHQGNLLFATWYTYGLDGKPLWLSTLMQRKGATNVFTGTLYLTSGPRFDAYVPPPSTQAVGTATITFADGNNATFQYTVQLAGMAAPATQTKSLVRYLFAAPAGTVCGRPVLTYVSGSSVKLEQVIGDCDWQFYDWADQSGTCKPTTSRTVTRFDILANGQGGSFEDNGKMIFLFGDTISKDPAAVNYHAADPLAWSTSTDPEAGLLLNFYTQPDGTPLFVQPPGVKMGADAIPNAGISLDDGVYLVCNTGSDPTLPNPQAGDWSVLVHFDEATQTFTAGRTISPPGGKFIATALHAWGNRVLMFGAGPYRASDIYLATTPAASFASGAGTQYFAGLVDGQPTWTASEAGAVPVVQDSPLGGPAWPNDSPTVGNLSVAYSSALGLWLMTYDGGRQSGKTRGVYFTYATQPWGPWATPQLIFNDVRDNGYGVFIHNPNIVPDPPGDGLNGPTIGSNDPYLTSGGGFAPLMIERFTTVAGSTLKIYYTLSTWNPYTVVKMRSQFTITNGP